MFKKKKIEILTLKKKQSKNKTPPDFWLSWKNPKVWHGCTYIPAPTNHSVLSNNCPLWRWQVFSSSQMSPLLLEASWTLEPRVRCLSPVHYLCLLVFRICCHWTGWIHTGPFKLSTGSPNLTSFLRNKSNTVTILLQERHVWLKLSSSIIIWRYAPRNF